MIAILMFTAWFFGAGLWSIYILPKPNGTIMRNNESIFCILAWIGWMFAELSFFGWMSNLNWNSPEFLFTSEGIQTTLVLGLMVFDLIWGKASSQIWMQVGKGIGRSSKKAFHNIYYYEVPKRQRRDKDFGF
jgi:hypothetical protein